MRERCGAAAEPDLMTAGKGLGGGVAIGALFGKPEIMEVWSRHVPSSGESPWASTFYAHPLACAGALAAVERLTSPAVAESVAAVAAALRTFERAGAEPPDAASAERPGAERPGGPAIRAVGAMAAFDSPLEPAVVSGARADSTFARLMKRGVLTIPGGRDGRTTSLYPAFTIGERQLAHALSIVMEELT